MSNFNFQQDHKFDEEINSKKLYFEVNEKQKNILKVNESLNDKINQLESRLESKNSDYTKLLETKFDKNKSANDFLISKLKQVLKSRDELVIVNQKLKYELDQTKLKQDGLQQKNTDLNFKLISLIENNANHFIQYLSNNLSDCSILIDDLYHTLKSSNLPQNNNRISELVVVNLNYLESKIMSSNLLEMESDTMKSYKAKLEIQESKIELLISQNKTLSRKNAELVSQLHETKNPLEIEQKCKIQIQDDDLLNRMLNNEFKSLMYATHLTNNSNHNNSNHLSANKSINKSKSKSRQTSNAYDIRQSKASYGSDIRSSRANPLDDENRGDGGGLSNASQESNSNFAAMMNAGGLAFNNNLVTSTDKMVEKSRFDLDNTEQQIEEIEKMLSMSLNN